MPLALDPVEPALLEGDVLLVEGDVLLETATWCCLPDDDDVSLPVVPDDELPDIPD